MKRRVARFLFLIFFSGVCTTGIKAQGSDPAPKHSAAIKHSSGDDASLFNQAMAFYKQGKYQLAVNDFTELLKTDSGNVKALASRAGAYYKLGRYDSATADYSTVLDNEPDDKEDKYLYAERGDAFRMWGQYKASVLDYSDALRIDSTRDTVWNNIGVDYYKLGRFDSAMYDFSKALTQRPNTPIYDVRFILALCANGSYTQAVSTYADYKQKKLISYLDAPDYSYLRTYISACTDKLSNNDFTNALPLLLQSITVFRPAAVNGEKSDSIEFANILAKTGFVYEKLNSLDSALTYYQKAQSINPAIQTVNAKISNIQYAIRLKATPPLVKLLAPQTRGITIETDSTGKTRVVIEAEVNKEDKIYVKGIVQSAAGIGPVKVNGKSVDIDAKGTDTLGNFETYIGDTTTIDIQAWNKNNVATDTIFHLQTRKSQSTSSNFIIPPVSDEETYHAVIIACSDYNGTKWPALPSTVSDADSLKAELVREYNFKPDNIVSIYNKTRTEIIKGLSDKLEALGDNDNVLIFYGGHGDLDHQTNIAYWVPLNTEAKQYEYISNGEITDILKNTKAKHVLVIADACYSGAMRGGDEYVPNNDDYKVKSRQILTSGAAEKVPSLSVFIPTVIEELKLYSERYYKVHDLYGRIYNTVKNESNKTPNLNAFEGIMGSISYGEFYFKKNVSDSSNHAKTAEEIATAKANEEKKRQEFTRHRAMCDSFIAVGKGYKDKDLLTEALAEFKKAIDINPDPLNTFAKNLYDEAFKLANLSPEAHLQLYVDSATANEDKRNHDGAIKWYKKAVGIAGIKPEQKTGIEAKMNDLYDRISFFKSIDEFYKISDYKGAKNEFSKKLKKQPNDVEYLMGRARCYDVLSDFSSAYQDLTQAIIADRTYGPSTKARALLQAKYGKKREAIADYQTYMTLNDDDIAGYMELYKLHTDREIKAKDEAITDLSNAIALDSKYTEAYYDRGLLYFDKEDYQRALADFNTVVQLDPIPAVNYYQRGESYLHLNKNEEAGFDFRTARARGLDSAFMTVIANNAEDINFLSTEAAGKSHWDTALIYVNRAILINPLSPVFRFEKGNYYFAENAFEEAIKNYDSAVYFRPAYNDALYKRGLAYYNLTQYSKAIENFDAVLKLNPADLRAAKGKADSHFALADYTDAATTYEDALKIIDNGRSDITTDETRSRINNNLGYSYYKINSLDPSIQALKRAVKFDENYALAYYNLGKSYEKSNDLDDAAQKIDKALTYDANNSVWNFSDADVYRNKGNFTKAIDNYTRSIDNDSLKLLKTAFYYRGYCYRQTGNYADAAKDYVTALKYGLDTGFQQFNNELGDVYYNLSSSDSTCRDSAYTFFKKSFDKDGSDVNAAAAYGMASVLFLQRKTDEAMILFEKAMSSKVISKNTIKADKNYDLFRADKRYKDIFNKYY